jgi:hypothetical protein
MESDMKKRKPQNTSPSVPANYTVAQIICDLCQANPSLTPSKARRIVNALLVLPVYPKTASSILNVLELDPSDGMSGGDRLADAIEDYEDTTLRAILEVRAEEAARVSKPKAQTQLSRLQLVKR